MLTHGTMDDNVPPNNTLLVVDALIKANKDFDMLMIPNVHHGYGEAIAVCDEAEVGLFCEVSGGWCAGDGLCAEVV